MATYGTEKVDTAASVNRKPHYVLEAGKNRFLDAAKPLNPVGRYIDDPKGTGRRANVQISAANQPLKAFNCCATLSTASS